MRCLYFKLAGKIRFFQNLNKLLAFPPFDWDKPNESFSHTIHAPAIVRVRFEDANLG